MSANTRITQRQNAATPLGRDLVSVLRQQITGTSGAGGGPRIPQGMGGHAEQALRREAQDQRLQNMMQNGGNVGGGPPGQFGRGIGPLQQQAGTAMQQLVRSLSDRTGGAEMDAVRDIQSQQREEASADVAERMGQAGNVAGSAAGFAQAETMRDLIPRQTRELASIRRQEEQQLMNAIGQLQQIGQQNLQPFMQIASQGLMRPDVSQVQDPLVTGIGALAGLAQGAGKAASGFG